MTATPFCIGLDDAVDPLVLALDVGSTASRGALFDATGRPISGRVKTCHAFTVGEDGTSQIDADQVTDEIAAILDGLAGPGGPATGRIRGVAFDTFASSLVAVGADGRALTPCYTYADSRCSAEVEELREELDETTVQQRTGTRLHTSYLAPRLRWLSRVEPRVFADAVRFVSLGEYVQLRLIGHTAAGTPTAAWTGMLDRRLGAWDPEILAAAGVGADRLSPVQDPGVPLSAPDATGGGRWPGLVGAEWFPAIGDGLGHNLGTGARDASAIGCGAATSGAMRVVVPGQPAQLPTGLWCYRIDADRSLLGGALTDVGRVFGWLASGIAAGLAPSEVDAVLGADPVPGTPAVVPFLTGERSTGWAARARMVMAGVSAAHGPADIVRGAAEGVAIGYARISEQLHAVAPEAARVAASGSVTALYPSFLQILADALQVPVEHVQLKRSTLLGTALTAIDAVAPGVERATPPVKRTFEPRPEHADHYAAVRARFDELYPVAIS